MSERSRFIVSRRAFSTMMAATVASPLLPARSRAQDQPQKDTTIRVAVSDFGADTLDPAMDSRGTILNQIVQMYDTWLEIGPQGELVPGLVESWKVDPSGLNWTFQLRKGVQFHDGWGEFTSADLAFSLRRFMVETARSPGGSVLRSIIDTIDEADPYTLRIRTKEISMNFAYLLSPHQQETGIVMCKRYLVENAGDDFEAQSKLIEQKPIGSGPFRYVSRELASSYTYEALPWHWRNTPRFKRLEILLVPESATQMAMLRNGEVDIISISGDQASEAEGAGMAVHSVPGALNIWVNFTGVYREPAKGKATTDTRVRKALSLAIDRKLILDNVLAGYGSLPLTPLNTLPAAADVDRADYTEWAAEVARYDPNEARRLLAEAGYPNGFSGVKFFTYTRPGAPFLPQLAEIITAQWAEVGAMVDIVAMDFGSYREHYVRADINSSLNAGDAGTHASGPRFDALGALINTWLYKGGVVQLMNDPEMDAGIARAKAMTDDAERKALVRDLMNRANDTWIALPLFDMDALFAVNPETVVKLEGFAGWPFLGRVLEKIEVA